MEKKIKIIESILDECLAWEKTEIPMLQEKKNRFMNILNSGLNKNNLICAVTLLSSKSYSKERFLELCIEQNILDDKDLLTDLFIHVHTMGHLYSYFRDYGFTFEKKLNYFENINIPFTCWMAKIDKLPETLTIYRGMNNKPDDIEECGFCWTLKEEKAKEFALCSPEKQRICYLWKRKNKGFVICGNINREDIFGYVTARDEDEIIVNPRLVENKKIKRIKKG